MKEADIVVTNPPFSLFKEYVPQLIKNKKKFIVLGNMNALTWKEIFPYFQTNVCWFGINNGKMIFLTPARTEKYMGNCLWYTNLNHQKRWERITLTEKYNSKLHPKYDNYDAIEVGTVKNIPLNYDGMMGVPISFMNKHNPDQFDIIGKAKDIGNSPLVTKIYTKEDKERYNEKNLNTGPVIIENGVARVLYARILIRRKL